MKIIIRIYRSFDYDLMALFYTGAIKIGSLAKKSLIAYYKNEEMNIEYMPIQKLPEKLPPSRTFILHIDDEDAAGFEDWFKNIRDGYKNQFVKSVMRYYLGRPLRDLYALGTWMQPDSDEPAPVVKRKKKKTQAPASGAAAKEPAVKPKENVKTQEKQKEAPKETPQIAVFSFDTSKPENEAKAGPELRVDPPKAEKAAETNEQNDAAFDAFDEINSLK